MESVHLGKGRHFMHLVRGMQGRHDRVRASKTRQAARASRLFLDHPMWDKRGGKPQMRPSSSEADCASDTSSSTPGTPDQLLVLMNECPERGQNKKLLFTKARTHLHTHINK
eukprot:285846-Pelagomonas_calceolata.AAC.2